MTLEAPRNGEILYSWQSHIIALNSCSLPQTKLKKPSKLLRGNFSSYPALLGASWRPSNTQKYRGLRATDNGGRSVPKQHLHGGAENTQQVGGKQILQLKLMKHHIFINCGVKLAFKWHRKYPETGKFCVRGRATKSR